MLTGDIPPNQTIYIKNLNEKVKKEAERRKRAEEAQQSVTANGKPAESNGGPMTKNKTQVEMVAYKSCFKCGYSTMHVSLSFQRQHDCNKVLEDKKIKSEKARIKKASMKKK